MIRKNLLGSFIFTIILFSFALFHSGVSAQTADYPNYNSKVGEAGSEVIVSTQLAGQYTENEGEISVVYTFSIAKELMDAKNLIREDYEYIRVEIVDPTGVGESKILKIIDENSSELTLENGYYKFTSSEPMPQGDYQISVKRTTGTDRGGDYIGLSDIHLGIDKNNPYETTTGDWGLPPSGDGSETDGTPGGSNPGGSPGSDPQAPGPVPDISAAGTGKLVGNIYLIILPIAIVVAVIKLLISLIGMATSSGDPQKLQQAKEDILATLLGLLLVVGAVSFIRILGNSLGL